MYTLNEIKTLPLCDVIIRPWKSFLIKIIKRVDRIYEVIVCNHWKRDITELWLSNTSIHWLLPGGVPLPQQREERINTAYSISAKEIKLWFIIVELKITEEQLLFWKGGEWKKKKLWSDENNLDGKWFAELIHKKLSDFLLAQRNTCLFMSSGGYL